MAPTGIEPTAAHPLGGSEIETIESEKAKEAGFSPTGEPVPVAAPTATSAEGTCI